MKSREEVEAIMAADLETLRKYTVKHPVDRTTRLDSWFANLLFRRLLVPADLPIFKELCNDL